MVTVCASEAWAGLKLVFEFLALTATRSAEARLATWDEIGLDAPVWTVPAARTKAGREHRVPLCSRAVEILEAARRLGVERTGVAAAGLAFRRQRGKTIGDARLSGALQQLGIGAVPHGFRSSFRDWASERTDHPREVVEAAPAHMVRNRTAAAYARSDLFERRRRLMDDWASYLGGERVRSSPLRRVTDRRRGEERARVAPTHWIGWGVIGLVWSYHDRESSSNVALRGKDQVSTRWRIRALN